MARTWIGRVVWVAAVVTASGAVAAACGTEPAARPEGPGAVAVVDDAGRRVALPAPAGRIVSLVPSVTETVVALGASDRLVARTRYDRDPALAGLPSVGGGLDPAVEALVGLRPDLVVAWDARDDRILRPRLARVGIPVYSAAVEDTAAVFSTIERMGALLGRERAADSLARALRDSLVAVAAGAPAGRPSVLYLIDGDPPRTAGAAGFIGQLVEIAGGRSAFPELDAAWPAVSLEAVLARSPDVIVLPQGPGLPTAAELVRRPGWRELPALAEGRVVGVPADLLARPGPGIARAARALRTELDRLEGR